MVRPRSTTVRGPLYVATDINGHFSISENKLYTVVPLALIRPPSEIGNLVVSHEEYIIEIRDSDSPVPPLKILVDTHQRSKKHEKRGNLD